MIKQIAFGSVLTILAAGVVGILGIDSAQATALPAAPVPQANLVVGDGLQPVADDKYNKKKYRHMDGQDKHGTWTARTGIGTRTENTGTGIGFM